MINSCSKLDLKTFLPLTSLKTQSLMERSRTQSTPRLTKFIRLVVYSYLTLNETMKKAARLSKQERTELEKSEIAKEGKVFGQTLNHATRPKCLLRNSLLSELLERIKIKLKFADKLIITVDDELDDYTEHMLGEELALILKALPTRFDAGKVSLEAFSLEKQDFYLDYFLL